MSNQLSNKYFVIKDAPLFELDAKSNLKPTGKTISKDTVIKAELRRVVRDNKKKGFLAVKRKGIIDVKNAVPYIENTSSFTEGDTNKGNMVKKIIPPVIGVASGLALAYFIKRTPKGFALFGVGGALLGMGVGLLLSKGSGDRSFDDVFSKEEQELAESLGITDPKAQKELANRYPKGSMKSDKNRIQAIKDAAANKWEAKQQITELREREQAERAEQALANKKGKMGG